MDNWIRWAFGQVLPGGEELNAGEKLVLVYLASQVGAAGVGLMKRDELAAAVGYEERSIQRLLKTLRDAQLLHVHESGLWFGLGPDPLVPPVDLVKPALLAPRPTDEVAQLVRQVAAGVSLISPDELEAAGETIARHLTEAGDGVLVRFNDVSLRLLQGIERIAQAARVWEEGVANAVAPPAPDPVRESAHFKVFMASGFMEEDEAYELAKKRLEAEGIKTDQAAAGNNARSIRRADTPPRVAAAPRETGAQPAGGRSYLDTPLGRFERVRDILDPEGRDPWADSMATWTRLEESENKHTVKGETDAFELLYPAMVAAARRVAGRMSLAEFLKTSAWDNPTIVGKSDSELEREIAHMLDEIERANHPMAQVVARTKEEGTGLTESTAQFHSRVLRVHQQLKKLQEMGV